MLFLRLLVLFLVLDNLLKSDIFNLLLLVFDSLETVVVGELALRRPLTSLLIINLRLNAIKRSRRNIKLSRLTPDLKPESTAVAVLRDDTD